jgi:hypothetical protein
MHCHAYGWLPAKSGHLLKKKVTFDTGNGNLGTIGHLNIPALLPDIFFYKFEVDQMRIMGTKKMPVTEQILVLPEIF